MGVSFEFVWVSERMTSWKRSLTHDRQAFIDILTEGEGDIGGVMQAAAGRIMGHAARDAEASEFASTAILLSTATSRL